MTKARGQHAKNSMQELHSMARSLTQYPRDLQPSQWLSRRTVLVCGAGGLSGQAAAQLCSTLGAQVLLSDKVKTKHIKVDEAMIDLRPREDRALFQEYRIELLIVAPGIALDAPVLEYARNANVPILTELDLGFKMICNLEQYHKRAKPIFIGITGTDGKSSTTSLITEAVQRSTEYTAIACANFGYPISSIALDRLKAVNTEKTIYVAECSSFQLEQSFLFHPQCAILLNLALDHRDRHPDRFSYLKSKLHISLNQGPEDLLLVPKALEPEASGLVLKLQRQFKAQASLPRITALDKLRSQKKAFFLHSPQAKQSIVAGNELRMMGLHQRMNLCFALACIDELRQRYSLEFDIQKLRTSLLEFRGLAHRLEYIKSLEFRKDSKVGLLHCYNDSKATTLQALYSALQSFSDIEDAPRAKKTAPIFLLCGGKDKGIDFKYICQFALELRIHIIVLSFGSAAKKIAQSLEYNLEKDAYKKEVYKVRFAGALPDLESATVQAIALAKMYFFAKEEFKDSLRIRDAGHILQKDKGEAVLLLSPACSSYDAYSNYMQRGEHFRRVIKGQ